MNENCDDFPAELAGKIFLADKAEAPDEVLAAARKHFGIKFIFPWQRLVIGNILDAAADAESGGRNGGGVVGKSADKARPDADYTDIFCLGRQIVLLPTGGGKSLCFLLPALLLKGPTLIFYPLLALMNDQRAHLEKAGIECVTFRGGQSREEREENFCRIKNGCKIILANPEVLQNENLLARLKECKISHIAIDEAHCVAEWGDSFRPAYLTLGKIIAELGAPLVTAFTATASPAILSRVSEVLFGGRVHIVRGESDRPNIRYYVEYACAKKKAACRLAATEQKPMIIFCGTRSKAEDMARELKECLPPEKIRFYHAGLSREEKKRIEDWFYKSTDGIITATCALGMGWDKNDIRTVIHTEPSPSAESYIQEAGRGGRDKKPSKAILLWSLEDSINAEKFPRKSREYVMKKFAESETCRRQVLLDALGGEQALCSGCDICESRKAARNKAAFGKAANKKKIYDARDAAAVHRFVRKNHNFYSQNQVAEFMKAKFNEADRKIFGTNIWASDDIQEIIAQLKKIGAVYDAGILWNHNLGAKKEIAPLAASPKDADKNEAVAEKNPARAAHKAKVFIPRRFLPSLRARVRRAFLRA